MIATGDTIEFDTHPIMDTHSIGGVPGNKVTLIIVPIVAAAGLLIPKTCSRAITGAGGTADLMEVLAPVEFSAQELKEITQKVGGVIAWGGATNIAPADDKLIKAEYLLSIDPYSQMLASIMGKKGAVGADAVVMDMPTGPGSKLPTMEEARSCSRDLIDLGRRLGMRVECAMTYGGAPVGRTIGCALEVREAMALMEGAPGPSSLREKSLELTGMLLELGGVASKGAGYAQAEAYLTSGAALKKFLEIVGAQGGDPNIKSTDIPLGEYVEHIRSPTSGYVDNFYNRRIVEIARLAGAPDDKGAGIYLHKKVGAIVKKGEPLITIYSSTSQGLEAAVKSTFKAMPVDVEGMLLEKYVEGS